MAKNAALVASSEAAQFERQLKAFHAEMDRTYLLLAIIDGVKDIALERDSDVGRRVLDGALLALDKSLHPEMMMVDDAKFPLED